MKNSFELTDVSLDALRELGNIGSGNAASALSLMLNQPVNVSVPKIRILDTAEVVEALGGPEQVRVGLLLSMTGDISGMILFLMEEKFAQTTVTKLMDGYIDDAEQSILEESAMKEIGNIMAACYVNAMSEFTGLQISISVPSINIDMLGSLLSVPAIYYANISDQIIFIENSLSGILKENGSQVLLIPEEDSLEKILKALEF